jgi:hypothetical protein
LPDLYQLAKCTVSTALAAYYAHLPEFRDEHVPIMISPNFRVTFCTPLGDTLFLAAINAKNAISDEQAQDETQSDPPAQDTRHRQLLEGAARILEEMGQALKAEREPERGEQEEKWYWDTLKTKFGEEITALDSEESLKEQQSGQIAVAAEVEMT